jgi:type I restriction enzyme S subunit
MEVKPGYKQTEVGVIPEDWEVKPLHALADRIMVGIASAATHAYRDRGIVMFRNQNIKPGYLDDSDILYIAEDYEAVFRNKRLKAGDLLTARTGYPGTTSIVPPQYEGAQSFTTLITRPRRDLVNSIYLCYFINSEAGQAYFEQNQIGGGQKNVNAGSLKYLLVPLPPTKAEQKAIAEALSDADVLIASLEQLVAKKRQIKQGATQELLHPKNGWVERRLGDIAEIRDGTHQTPKYVESGIPFFSVENVTSGDFTNTKFISKAEHRFLTRSFKIERGDILMTRIGSIGNCKLITWDVDASFYVSLALLKIRKGYSAAFICHYSRTAAFNKEVELHSLQSAIPKKINLGPISDVRITLPDQLDEQTAIATILSDMDAEIAALEAKLAKARQVKQGMMQELLTGRIRLI